MAVVGNGEIGRYQTAPWMTQAAGGTVSRTGYYIPDKTTGNVVTSKAPEYCLRAAEHVPF